MTTVEREAWSKSGLEPSGTYVGFCRIGVGFARVTGRLMQIRVSEDCRRRFVKRLARIDALEKRSPRHGANPAPASLPVHSLILLCGCFLLLSSCGLRDPSPAGELRLVRVKAVADRSLRLENRRWQATINGLLTAASDYFEDEFGIRLVVKSVGPWEPTKSSTSTRVLLAEFKETYPLDGNPTDIDLMVGFTGSQVDVHGVGLARADRLGNCTEGLGNYIVSASTEPFRYYGKESQFEWDALAVIHELGHIFGASHTDEPASIMHREFAYRTRFDRKNKGIILRNKFCPFHKG